jgi:hypothetical protein
VLLEVKMTMMMMTTMMIMMKLMMKTMIEDDEIQFLPQRKHGMSPLQIQIS